MPDPFTRAELLREALREIGHYPAPPDAPPKPPRRPSRCDVFQKKKGA